MMQAAKMCARLAADQIAVADESAHVLTAVLVAASKRARDGVSDNKINRANVGNPLKQQLGVRITMREVDRFWDHVHVALVGIDAMVLAPCLEPLGNASSTLDCEIKCDTLPNAMSTPGDARPDVSHPIDGDAGLIRPAGPHEGGHGANVEYALNQRFTLRQKLDFAPSDGDKARARDCKRHATSARIE